MVRLASWSIWINRLDVGQLRYNVALIRKLMKEALTITHLLFRHDYSITMIEHLSIYMHHTCALHPASA